LRVLDWCPSHIRIRKIESLLMSPAGRARVSVLVHHVLAVLAANLGNWSLWTRLRRHPVPRSWHSIPWSTITLRAIALRTISGCWRWSVGWRLAVSRISRVGTVPDRLHLGLHHSRVCYSLGNVDLSGPCNVGPAMNCHNSFDLVLDGRASPSGSFEGHSHAEGKFAGWTLADVGWARGLNVL
jgi:hypothetical protein